MRTEIVSTIVGGIVAITALTFLFLIETDKNSSGIPVENKVYNQNDINVQTLHDWECKFIVEDYYTTDEGTTIHYVHDVIENVDGSITFVGEDGLLTRIPYPYYKLEKNPKEK